MEDNIFKFILKHSKKDQIILLIFTIVSFPFLYYSLDLPKTIINKAIGGGTGSRDLLGWQLGQMEYLLALCTIFLALVFVNGGFKYFLNVYRGVVGERMLRRLRYDLFHRILRFPLPQFRKVSQGEIVSMVTAETEPLGGFVGDSISLPAFQGGTLLTILIFMFVQDWVLGLAAIALYPIQMYVIPKLQTKVNELRKARTIKVRKLSERIGEVVTGIQELHAHDTSRYELADYSVRMDEIFRIRYDVYKLKFLIKFLNNFIAQLTPFFFYSIGGYLVIKGDLSFGALVAVLAAYKDLSAPWKELLTYYQQQADSRIKYDLLLDTFQPGGMLDENMQSADPTQFEPLAGEIVGSRVDLREEDESDSKFSGNASFEFPLMERVAVIGDADSGKGRLAMTLAGLKKLFGGRVTINDVELSRLPETVTGRQIAYVGSEPILRAGTLRDNLFYPLKHRPVTPASYTPEDQHDWEDRQKEARRSGNSDHDINADWIDYEALGVAGPAELTERALDVLSQVDMDEGVYKLGLHGYVDPDARPELAQRLLEARQVLRERLTEPEFLPLVEPFDRETYNINMSIAENLLFGSPRDDSLNVDELASDPYVRKVLDSVGLTADLLSVGRQVAEIMLDLFTDVPPGSDLFDQFSFIDADDLPEFKALLSRSDQSSLETLEDHDKNRLISLSFKIIPTRHRLGLVDDPLQHRLLAARKRFHDDYGADSPPIEFFDRDRINHAVSVQDNILFGRPAYGKARSTVIVGELISEVVEQLGLRRAIMELGLDYPVGVAGARLTPAQRQKIAIARCILKQPRLLIIDQATAALEPATQKKVMDNLVGESMGCGLIWILHRASLGASFDQALVMDSGRVVQQGTFENLDTSGFVD